MSNLRESGPRSWSVGAKSDNLAVSVQESAGILVHPSTVRQLSAEPHGLAKRRIARSRSLSARLNSHLHCQLGEKDVLGFALWQYSISMILEVLACRSGLPVPA
jgi:hypothetical protein